mgnify:FL=1
MGLVQGVCSACGGNIRRDSPVPMAVTCDCYKVCPLCRELMEPYAPDLSPHVYRNEQDPGWDPLGLAEKGEASAETVYVCVRHDPPYYSSRLPVEVWLE